MYVDRVEEYRRRMVPFQRVQASVNRDDEDHGIVGGATAALPQAFPMSFGILRKTSSTIAPGHWKTQFRVGGRFACTQPLSQPVSPSSESSPSRVASRAPLPSTDRNPDVDTASLIDEIFLSLNVDVMTDNNDAPPPLPVATLSPETLAMIAAITAALRPQNQPPVQPPPSVVPPFTGAGATSEFGGKSLPALFPSWIALGGIIALSRAQLVVYI
ncbi:hypothetical protein B0H13DRAFT_2306910 [Mycena leptocephala]|nr:hypothetical protein B0H13DRAFT_2306910 [Mycena leptocephala]